MFQDRTEGRTRNRATRDRDWTEDGGRDRAARDRDWRTGGRRTVDGTPRIGLIGGTGAGRSQEVGIQEGDPVRNPRVQEGRIAIKAYILQDERLVLI